MALDRALLDKIMSVSTTQVIVGESYDHRPDATG
jgi:hypothetical protein